MRFKPALALVFMSAACLAQEPASRPASKVEFAGLKIGGDFKHEPQMLLHLRFQNFDGKILGPSSPFTVTRIVDDQGTELIAKEIRDDSAKYPELIGTLSVDDDKKAATLEIVAPAPPAANATKIFLEGTARIAVGSDIKTTTWKNFRLRLGQWLRVDTTSLRLSGLHDYSDIARSYPEETFVYFTGTEGQNISDIRIFDAEKKQIGRSKNQGHPHADDFLKPNGFDAISCYVFNPGNEVTLEVDRCAKIDVIDVPVKLEISLDAAPKFTELKHGNFVDSAYRYRTERLANEARAATRPARVPRQQPLPPAPGIDP